MLAFALVLSACAPFPTPTAFPDGDSAHPITIAVSPAGGASYINGTELAARLEQSTGSRFKLTLSLSNASAVSDLSSGAAQIGWLDPLAYVVVRKRIGADVGLVAVRNGSDHFSSQIIANAGAGFRGPADLRGQRFCFSPEHWLESYTIPSIILKANGVDQRENPRIEKLRFNEQVAEYVFDGKVCVAGSTMGDARAAIQDQFPDVMDKVVVLEASPDIPNDAIVFVKGFPADLRGRITSALESLARTADGRNLLHVEGLVRSNDSAYDRLRDLLTKAAADPANYIQ